MVMQDYSGNSDYSRSAARISVSRRRRYNFLVAPTQLVFRGRLLRWYRENRRDLPWRTLPGEFPDPYHVLVSEAMLQQTQVATVIPYFRRFIGRFPTLHSLASAGEQEVLRLWQGLGYYARARNLQATAKLVLNRYSGRLPSTVEELMSLPGIGRYTAGAIASLAYGIRAPILDGNVIRVLCRLDDIPDDPRQPAIRERLWMRAEEILPKSHVDEFNSALMELGATVCTPRAPRCEECPVREHCRARAAGTQAQRPVSAPAGPRPHERRWTIAIRHAGRYLIEQRPRTGRWAGLWQFTTFSAGGQRLSRALVRRQLGVSVGPLKHLGQLSHDLSHRRYEFDVYSCDAGENVPAPAGRRWARLDQLDDYPLPLPHLRIAEMLKQAMQVKG